MWTHATRRIHTCHASGRMARNVTQQRKKDMAKKQKARLKPLMLEFRHPDTKEWIKTEFFYDPKTNGFDKAVIWEAVNEVDGMEGWAWEASLDQDVTWTPFGGNPDEDWHEFTLDEKSEMKNDEFSLKVEVLPGFIWKDKDSPPPDSKARKNAAAQEACFGAESPEPAPSV